MKIIGNIKDPSRQREVVVGFLGGLNTFQDETVIKDNELTNAKNIILSVDGVQPRYGTLNSGDDGSDTSIKGAFPYYNYSGTRTFLRMSGGKLKKLVAGAWTQIGSTTWNSSARANFVQARDKVFIFNGVNPLRYYDGSAITTYSSLSTPGTPTVTPTGTTGSTSYSYRISAFNAVGETLAGTAGTTATGNATLTTTNYNAISWTAVGSAVGYNIWGRKSTGFGESYLATVYTNSFNDTGNQNADENYNYTPSTTLLPPDANSTEGIICKFAVYAISRIFAAGDPANPSRLYYGGLLDNVGNFSLDRERGGGYVDVFKNDGQIIRSIIPFQGGVIIWKDNAIYKLSVNSTSGFFQLEEITRSFGGISFRGCRAVENDIIFPARKDGRLAFYSLGNQENYAGTVLRTNELSIKISSRLTDVALAYLEDSCGYYFNNIYMCAIPKSGSTTNDRIWCLDTRFGAWTYWEGFSPDVFVEFQDSTGSTDLYYGASNTGYMVKMFQDDRNDNGVAIDVAYSTKSFNQKIFGKYKRYFNPTFQFKDVNRSGELTGEIYLDGVILSGGFSINQQNAGGAGVGAGLVGFVLAGDAGSSTTQGTGFSSDIVQEVYMSRTGRSIKYNFASSGLNLQYKFLSLSHEHIIQEDRRLPSTYRSYPMA